jgi:hypothetical protein
MVKARQSGADVLAAGPKAPQRQLVDVQPAVADCPWRPAWVAAARNLLKRRAITAKARPPAPPAGPNIRSLRWRPKLRPGRCALAT